jgi:dUTP pyrophosphatase
MNIIKIKKLYNDVKLPEAMTEGASGFDVYCHRIEKKADNLYICYTGFGVKIPDNTSMLMMPRSSITKHNWVLGNSVGLLDPDYVGELQFRFRGIPINAYKKPMSGNFYLDYEPFPYKVGDRIGQILLIPKLYTTFKQVNELEETDRGDGGFGSTGIK